jgi:diguanylate cyclase (GGDEF)-like protein
VWQKLRSRFIDLRIGTKIIGVSLVVASMFAAVGVVGLLNIERLVNQQDREYRINVLALARMTDVRSAVGAQQEAVLSYILSDPGFYRDSYRTVIVNTDLAIDRDIAAIRRINLPAAEREGLRAFAATVKMWRTARDSALNASLDGDQKKAASIVLVRSEAVARAVKDRADAFLKQLVDAVASGARHAQQSGSDAARLMLVLLVSGTIAGVTLSVLAARTISGPLGLVVDVLSRVARGDLSHRVDLDRNDEVGKMSRSLDETLAVLRGAFDEVSHRASHDGLTGLANRALLRERISTARPNARAGIPVAMLLIDLDGFKQVNDVHGHAAGDHVLTVVAERLLAAVRGADTVARLGGDEFAVLLDGMDEADDVYAVADRLLRDIQAPADFNGTMLTPRASIGVTLWDGEVPIDALMHDADLAMYTAKTHGKGKVVRFDAQHEVTVP